jgi:uncharacterized protein YvpB
MHILTGGRKLVKRTKEELVNWANEKLVEPAMDELADIINRISDTPTGRNFKAKAEKLANKTKKYEENSDESASVLKMNRLIQLDTYTCGVQATHTILKYHGKAHSIKNTYNKLNVDKNGYATETSIYRLCRERGLIVSVRPYVGIKIIKESIDKYAAPILTTFNGINHWVVIYGYSDSHIYVLDSLPYRTSVKISKQEFRKECRCGGTIIYKKA